MISLLLLKQIAQLFLALFLGWILVKAKVLKPEDSRVLSALVLYGITPCVSVGLFQTERTPDRVQGLLFSMLIALIAHAIYLVLTTVLKRPFRLCALDQANSVYSNCGNLIVPLVAALFGKEWLIYTVAYTFIQQILHWSHGRILVSGEKHFSMRNIFLNVNLISLTFGAILFFLDIQLPETLTNGLDSVGGMIGPLTMVIAGMLICGQNPKTILSYRGVWKVSALRLIVFPLFVLFIVKVSGITSLMAEGETIMMISLLAACAPSAGSITQLASLYGRDATYSGAVYTVTTLLCIVTMPLMIMLFQLF